MHETSRTNLSLAAGGAGLIGLCLLTRGRKRRSLLLAGGGMAAAAAWRSLVALPEAGAAPELTVRHAITVQTPADEAFRLWRDPAIQAALTPSMEIRVLDSGNWRWRRRITAGRGRSRIERTVEWETELAEEQPPRRAGWRSLPRKERSRPGHLHPPFQLTTDMRFHEVAPPPGASVAGSATEMRLELRFTPWDEPASRRLSRRMFPVMRSRVERGLGARLFRFKQLAETGEIVTIEGQPSGRRSAWVREMEPFDRGDSILQRLRGVG